MFRVELKITATASSILNLGENGILPEPQFDGLHITSSMPDLAEKIDMESTELEAGERDDLTSVPSSTSEIDSAYDEETIARTIEEDYENEVNDEITPSPYYFGKKKANTIKSISSVPLVTTTTVASVPPKSAKHKKYPVLKKVPSRFVAVSSDNSLLTTKRSKKVARSTTEKMRKVTKGPRPATPIPHNLHHNPYHPHGVVVYDKRKKRPKPVRVKTRPATTTTSMTTTTSAPTTKSTPATPLDSEDYYEYYLGSGESGESLEDFDKNSTLKNNSTSNKKRIKSKIPLSKLAMAMIASSAVFDNGTGEPVFYPKSPVNLLNILQTYTKQLQLANGEAADKQPAVQLQTTPFVMQLSQLPFGTRIAISIYYSLIAIIPLVYLAFGGLGRLGILNAFAGRSFVGGRRKRSNYAGDRSHFKGNYRYPTTIVQRADLGDRHEDEYMWILGRISEIILEFSLHSDEREK